MVETEKIIEVVKRTKPFFRDREAVGNIRVKGLADYANPASIFKAAEMLLRHIGLIAKADQLAAALTTCNETEKAVVVTGTREGATCEAFADYVIAKLG